MIKTLVWYADADEPTEWFEAVIALSMETSEECTACGKKTRSAIDVEEGMATLCLTCLDQSLATDEVRLADRTKNQKPEDVMPYRDKAVEQAKELGRRHGRAAGSWMFNGNTEQEHYATMLRGCNDGDPEVLDRYRAPLSGEFADDLTPAKLLDELVVVPSVKDEVDEYEDLIESYESAHSEAFWNEVVDICRTHLGMVES